MSTFVLVHGAWHGGWCWERVTRLLAAAGATVYAPTLTGLGERAHLASRDVTLETHIGDIVGVLESELLTDAVLVGHSYAGMVVTAVADRVPHRLSRLVYLDAVVPKNDQCLFDCAGVKFRERIEEQVRTQGEGWKIPFPSADGLGLIEDDDIQWTMPRLVAHPYRTFCERVSLQHPLVGSVPRSYLNCIGSKSLGQPRTTQAEGIDDYYEVQTGHDAMVTAPTQVFDLLRRIA
jgi:pimeloyl-ACP methyl ester carboxylesterase